MWCHISAYPLPPPVKSCHKKYDPLPPSERDFIYEWSLRLKSCLNIPCSTIFKVMKSWKDNCFMLKIWKLTFSIFHIFFTPSLETQPQITPETLGKHLTFICHCVILVVFTFQQDFEIKMCFAHRGIMFTYQQGRVEEQRVQCLQPLPRSSFRRENLSSHPDRKSPHQVQRLDLVKSKNKMFNVDVVREL